MSPAISLVVVEREQCLIEGSLYTSEELLLFHTVNSVVTLIFSLYLLSLSFSYATISVSVKSTAIILNQDVFTDFPTLTLYCRAQLEKRRTAERVVCRHVCVELTLHRKRFFFFCCYVFSSFVLTYLSSLLSLLSSIISSFSVPFSAESFLCRHPSRLQFINQINNIKKEIKMSFMLFFVVVFVFLSGCLLLFYYFSSLNHSFVTGSFLLSPSYHLLPLLIAPDGLSQPTLTHATDAKLNVSWSAPANANAPGPLHYSLQMRTSPHRPVIR